MNTRLSPQVMSRQIDLESVLVILGQDLYYSLNEVGTRALELLQETGSIAEVKRLMAREFDVDPERLFRDLDGLFGEMIEAGLLETPGDERG